MDGFATSFWLKRTLATALERDPVDALADAEALTRALREHCDSVLQRTPIEAMSYDCFRPLGDESYPCCNEP
jgi:hypothetical protein